MLRNRMFALLGLLVIASMVLAACGAPAATEAAEPAATEAAAPAATEAPAEPTPAPTTRTGGWLDEVALSSVSADQAVT